MLEGPQLTLPAYGIGSGGLLVRSAYTQVVSWAGRMGANCAKVIGILGTLTTDKRERQNLDPSTKSFSIAKAVNQIMSFAKIEDEIKKCQVLCSNCHRKTTERKYRV